MSKVIEVGDQTNSEKIEIGIRTSQSRNSIRIRVYLWDDRWLWVDARKSKKEGWDWEYTSEGRFSNSVSVRELMLSLKSFCKDSESFNVNNVAVLANTYWGKVIAKGPQKIVD